MKLILLAATALIATPVIAQDMTGTAPAQTQATPPATGDTAAQPDATTTGDPAAQQAPTAPATPPAPTGDTMGGATAAPQGMSTGSPVGGYQPSRPALSGNPAPGQTPQFQAAPSPSEAYPAPAPLASYPICKKGQYDQCRQRGGK